MPARLVALTLFVCLLWASSGVVVKLALADAPPLGLGALRMLLSALLLTAWIGRERLRRWSAVPWRLVVQGVVFYALLQAFTHLGFRHTSAARGVVLLNTTPFFVALFAHLLPPYDTVPPKKVLGLMLAFAGVSAMFAGGFSGGGPYLGDALMLLAALSWAFHTLTTQRATRDMKPDVLLLTQFLGAGVAMAAISAAGEPLAAWHPTPRLALGVAYLAVAGTVLAWLLWVTVLKRVPAASASVFIFTVPLIGVALSALVLGEPLTLSFLVCAVLVSAGIWLVNAKRPLAGVPSGHERTASH